MQNGGEFTTFCRLENSPLFVKWPTELLPILLVLVANWPRPKLHPRAGAATYKIAFFTTYRIKVLSLKPH